MARPTSRFKLFVFTVILVLLALLLLTFNVLASSGGDYELGWYTMDGGGGTSAGGDFGLSGTIGQPDVGAPSGGDFSLNGGFWGYLIQKAFEIFLPLILQ